MYNSIEIIVPIFLLLIGGISITILTKFTAKWIYVHHFLERFGYFAVALVSALVIIFLMLLQWIIYQNPDKFNLAYLFIGIIIGIIFGMLPKSNSVILHKNEEWFMKAVALEFLLIIYAFASLYFFIELISGGSFIGFAPWNNFLSGIFEFLYLSISIFSTVGFGDIQPVTTIAKFAVCVELLIMFRTITLAALVVTKDRNIPTT